MIDDIASRTTTQLLDRLARSGDETAWFAFDQRYRPIVRRVLARMGFAPADAADLAQETIVQFLEGYRAGRYERSKGRLRSWLAGITRRTALKHWRTVRQRREVQAETWTRDEVPAPNDLEALWNREADEELLERALELLRTRTGLRRSTLEAFRLTAVELVPAAQAAERLHLSVDQVYQAKHGCTRKLRQLHSELRAIYEMESAFGAPLGLG